jgi:hypothetical protein
LRELLHAELASLRLLEEALRTGKDAASHGRVMKRARMLPECETSRQYQRYRKDADSRFFRAHKRLEETVALDAQHAGFDKPDDSADLAGEDNPEMPDDGTTVKSATPRDSRNEPENGATVKSATPRDSRNEPSHGTIDMTAPATAAACSAGAPPDGPRIRPPGGFNGLALVLLGILLGQLFGGFRSAPVRGGNGRLVLETIASAHAPGAEEPEIVAVGHERRPSAHPETAIQHGATAPGGKADATRWPISGQRRDAAIAIGRGKDDIHGGQIISRGVLDTGGLPPSPAKAPPAAARKPLRL